MKKFTLLADKNIQASFKVVLDKELIGQNKEFLFKVHIAASEALQNIVRHIYHFEKNKEVRIWFEKNKSEMTLFIEDDGPPLRDLSFLSIERTPNEEGNMGINLIKKLTKSFNIETSQKGNLTILKFEIF